MIGAIFILAVAVLLGVYWFVPFQQIEFGVSGNTNFSVDGFEDSMQFYPDMRFPSSDIPYRIDGCPLQKQDDMERGFAILGNETGLNFYPVSGGEEISVGCDSNVRIENGMFIAGEGGPTNITQTGKFNVILSGRIMLLKDSECEKPNVAIHELLHVLGFKHSENPNNIMYNYSKCGQTIGDDIINLLKDLYAVPSEPDLAFESVNASVHGRYLDAEMNVRNVGLQKAGGSKISIYADGKLVEEVELDELEVGYGRKISLKNVGIMQISVSELDFEIEYDYEELNKENNNIKMEINN